ncbi:uncharacterized protein EDB93DRAFT_1298423 [Suillus bovinus]|uniref:uncharacterized protein n=1 Tax=Suillus bovinus TaxID=48563 RepID=UPI001B85B6E0|nr:uncharacterized protein EDB93DRAFT_1298423 [Suillus bovinus]KAG2139615.1 hypothetical protein EDB93DRAFT_1298423 [Suillus bovinus]
MTNFTTCTFDLHPSYEKLHFPPIFRTLFGLTALLYSAPTLSNPSFSPTALLYSTSTLSNSMSYGEGVSTGCIYSLFPVPQVPSHSHTHVQSHPDTCGKDHSSKTPINCPILTVQMPATKKTDKVGRHASQSVKSPSSAAPSASALKHSAAATATAPASTTTTSLNPLLTFILHLCTAPFVLSRTFILAPFILCPSSLHP